MIGKKRAQLVEEFQFRVQQIVDETIWKKKTKDTQ